MTSKEGSMLPRELIVWLQSLQLSHHIKHPKRDLSNGYIIAQICHYYWGSNAVSLHSFTNACGVANKQSNWSVLRKSFAKQNIPLSEEMISGMICCKDKYAECFLCQLYTILTGKELKQQSLELETQNKELSEKEISHDIHHKTSADAKQIGAIQMNYNSPNNNSKSTENKIQVYDRSDNVNDHINLNNNQTVEQVELREEMVMLQKHSTALEYVSWVISRTLQKYIQSKENVNSCSNRVYCHDSELERQFVALLSKSATFCNEEENINNINDKSSVECERCKYMQFISHFVQCAERQQVNQHNAAVNNKTHDTTYSAVVMDAVWSALHARLPLVVEHYVAQREMNVIDLVQSFLFVQKEFFADTETEHHDFNEVAPLTLCDQSFTFIHALLSLWSDNNPHACFNFGVQHLLTLPSLLYALKYNTNYIIADKLSFMLCAMLSSRSLTLATRQAEQMCSMLKHHIYNVNKYYYFTKHAQKTGDTYANVMIDLPKAHHYNKNESGNTMYSYTQEDKTQAYLLIMQTFFIQIVKRYSLDSNMYSKTKLYNYNVDHDGSNVYSVQMKTRSTLVNRASIKSAESFGDLREHSNVHTNYENDNNEHEQECKMLQLFVQKLFCLIKESMYSESAQLKLLATSVAVSLVKHASSVLSLSFINTSLLPLFFSEQCLRADAQDENKEEVEITTNYFTEIDIMKIMLTRRLWQQYARFDCITKDKSKKQCYNKSMNSKYKEQDENDALLQYIRSVLLHVLHEYSCRLLWSCSKMDKTQPESTSMLKLHNALAYELAICLSYVPEEATTTISSIGDGDYNQFQQSKEEHNKQNDNQEEKRNNEYKLKCNAYTVALFIAQSLLYYYRANKTLDALLSDINNNNNIEANNFNYHEQKKSTQEIHDEANRGHEGCRSRVGKDNSSEECNLLPPIVHCSNVFSCSSPLLFTKALFGLYPSYFSTIPELAGTADELIMQNMVESVINNETGIISSNKADKINSNDIISKNKGASTRDVHTVNNKIKQRLSNRVSALSRQKNVPVDVNIRICWLYVIIRTASSSSRKYNQVQSDLHYEAFHTSLPTLRERKALRRKWNVLLQLAYDDIALITMAAELVARQLHNRANTKNEESTNKLLQLAAQAQHVVCYWYAALSLPDETSKNIENEDGEREVESTVVRAMKWYHEVFGRETSELDVNK